MIESVCKNKQVKEEDKYIFFVTLTLMRHHELWDNMPMMQIRTQNPKLGVIQQFKASEVSTEPIGLPQGFEWCNIDLKNEDECEQVIEFLKNNYIMTGDKKFRLSYTKEHLRWICCTPNYSTELHIGVRNEQNKKIMGVLFGMPKKYMIMGQTVKAPDMICLCVHAKLRQRKLANVLIQEMARRLKL